MIEILLLPPLFQCKRLSVVLQVQRECCVQVTATNLVCCMHVTAIVWKNTSYSTF